MILLILSILLVYLTIASCCDLKYLEVPDWLSFSLILLGISFGFGLSIMEDNWFYLLESLAGFGFAYLLAAFFYYTGQWGGGDAKVLMGLGAFMGLSLDSSIPFISLLKNSLMGFNFLSFIFFCMVGGALFGMGIMIYYAIKHRKEFMKEYSKRRKQTTPIFRIVLISTLSLFGIAFFLDDFLIRVLCLMLGLIVFFGYFLFVFVRAVEKSAMIKELPISKISPGDWLMENVVVDGKTICLKKKTGIDEKDIKKLKKLARENKIKRVKVRYGYPFVPGFLIGLILYMFLGNLLVKVFLLLFG